VKPTSNTKRTQKAKVTKAPTIKSTYPENLLPSKTTSNSPPTTPKTNPPSSKAPVKSSPLTYLQPPASAAPSKEDFVHRLKRKSLKKLRASLLSQVWKDERSVGGQLKPSKKGERREIGILAEDDDRNRKKKGGGEQLSGTRPISKTTNNLLGVSGPSEDIAKVDKSSASNAVSTEKKQRNRRRDKSSGGKTDFPGWAGFGGAKQGSAQFASDDYNAPSLPPSALRHHPSPVVHPIHSIHPKTFPCTSKEQPNHTTATVDIINDPASDAIQHQLNPDRGLR